MKRIISPQEKKIQSYMHDGRNMYGENRTGAINALRRRKAIGSRRVRRIVAQKLRSSHDDQASDAIPTLAQKVARDQRRKYPDRPLVEYVENRWRRRRRYKMQPEREASELMLQAKRRLRKKREITEFLELP